MSRERAAKIIRLIRVGKRFIERSGLSLGDALNVALFALTIASLFIAVLGVGVAWITYKKAVADGESQAGEMKKQEAALDSAAVSLLSAKKVLDESKTTLTSINDGIGKSLVLGEEQRKNLSASVSLSTKQLAAMSKTPYVTMTIRCGGDLDALSRQQPIVLIPPKVVAADLDDAKATPVEIFNAMLATEKRYQLTVHTTAKPRELITCKIDLDDTGQAPLTDAFAKVEGSVGSEFAVRNFKYRIGKEEFLIRQVTKDSGNAPIDLIDTKELYPSSTSGITHVWLEIDLMPTDSAATLKWKYGGHEMNPGGAVFNIEIEHQD